MSSDEGGGGSDVREGGEGGEDDERRERGGVSGKRDEGVGGVREERGGGVRKEGGGVRKEGGGVREERGGGVRKEGGGVRKEGGGEKEGPLFEMEVKMREQIKQLQEQRAATMMNEIVELQRERDLAVGRVRRMEKKVADLQAETSLMRESLGKGDRLERALLEEQLLTSDLRKKLQSADKQNGVLTMRVRKLEMELGKSPTVERLGVLGSERSKSLTDLKQRDNPQSDDKPPSPLIRVDRSSSFHEVRGSRQLAGGRSPRQKRYSLQVFSGVEAGSYSPSNGSSPQSYSPTVMPRRYKLAAALCRHTSTQTDSTILTDQSADQKETDQSDSHKEGLPQDILDALASAKSDVIRLQQEKQQLESRLEEEERQRETERKKEKAMKKECESLQLECGILRDSLGEFSRWTRQKLQLLEEDMDIFKVIYSLHGSLSQEVVLLQELKHKLQKSELRVAQLEMTNRHLTQTVSETEEKYQHSRREMRHLHEKLLLNSPHTSSPLEHNRYRKHSSPVTTHRHPSPSTTHRHPSPSTTHRHPSPSTTHRHPSPSTTHRHTSPSTTHRHPSPSTTHRHKKDSNPTGGDVV